MTCQRRKIFGKIETREDARAEIKLAACILALAAPLQLIYRGHVYSLIESGIMAALAGVLFLLRSRVAALLLAGMYALKIIITFGNLRGLLATGDKNLLTLPFVALLDSGDKDLLFPVVAFAVSAAAVRATFKFREFGSAP